MIAENVNTYLYSRSLMIVTNLNTLHIYDKQEMRHSFHFRNILKFGPAWPGPSGFRPGPLLAGRFLGRPGPRVARPVLCSNTEVTDRIYRVQRQSRHSTKLTEAFDSPKLC